MRLLLLLAGCFPSFDPASHVEGLRVLAIKAEPPEVGPGETATLTTLVFESRGATPTYQWSLCLRPPLPGSSVSVDCFNTDLGDATIPLGEGPTIQVTMPNLRADQLGIPDFTGGVYLPVILEVNDGAETVTSVYRLRYSTPLISLLYPNHNPHIEDVLIAFDNDAGTRPLDDLHIHTGDRVALRAQTPEADHEIYPQIEGKLELPDLGLGGFQLPDGGFQLPDGGITIGGITLTPVSETLKVSWFANIGRLDPDVTGNQGKLDTTLYLDKFLVAPPADIDLYVVVRDDRGGTDFAQRKLLLR